MTIVDHIKDKSEEAKAILDGAGPKEYKVVNRTWKVGDSVYVDEEGTEWVDVLNVKDPEKAEDDSCIMSLKGKLTIRGFSKRRQSALIEYTAPPDSGGCSSSVYFFYRVE